MKPIWTLAFSIFLLAARPLTQSEVDSLYADGQQFFAEKKFTEALANFEQVGTAVPNDSRIDSWIAACLNELGRFPAAKDRLEMVIQRLQDDRIRARDQGKDPEPIDVGYFTLLARVQANMKEFDRAIETLEAFTFQDDGSEGANSTKAALDTARKILKTQFAAAGAECLRSGDIDGTRRALTQAERVHPATPTTREWLARDSLARAEQAPGASDEERAAKSKLYQAAVAASRLWLEEAAAAPAPAQRVLADALLGTKTREGYGETLTLLGPLATDLEAISPTLEASRALDIASAHTGLEQWDLALDAAAKSIKLDPADPLGRAYCLRSYAHYQLGRCPEAVTEGRSCKNPDGSPRQLRHVEICEQREAKLDADQAAAAEDKRKRKCNTVYARVQWAKSFLNTVALDDLLEIAKQFRASEQSCRAEFDAAERAASGGAFSSPMPEFCPTGAKAASSPLNLASKPREELEALRKTTEEFLELCGPSLDSTQIAGVKGAIGRVGQLIK